MKNLETKRRGAIDRVLFIGSFVFVSLTVVSALVLSRMMPLAFAEESSVSTATVVVSVSCSLSGTVETPHTATLYNGTYSGTNYPTGIGQTILKAYCNDSSGFAIYAIGYTGNEDGNTVLHSDVLGSGHDIETGIYSSGSTTDSTWSMKLAAQSGTYAPIVADGTNGLENFTTWHVIPSSYKKVAYRNSGTDVPINGVGVGSSITTTYDAYVSETQSAGTYLGQVKYTLVHPATAAAPVSPLKPTDCPANSICYAPNANDIVGTMVTTEYSQLALTSISASEKAGRQTKTWNNVSADNTANIVSYSEAELIAPNFSRPGYGFAGWSTEWDATTASNPVIYGPNERIRTGNISTNGLILYPVWIAATGTIQDWSGCNTLTTAPADGGWYGTRATLSSMTALRDTRDNNVYTVARLADGKCWMVENLRLDSANSLGSANIAKAQGYDTNNGLYGDFVGLANSEDATFGGTTANSLYSINGSTSINIGNDSSSEFRFPRYNNNNTNNSANATNSSGTSLVDNNTGMGMYYRWYSYGNYYTWPAAIASTNYYSSGNGYVEETSICPSGWHLPSGGATNETDNNPEILEQEEPEGEYYFSDFYTLGYTVLGGYGADCYNEGEGEGLDEGCRSSYDSQTASFLKFPNNFIRSGRYYNNTFSTERVGAGKELNYWANTSVSDYARAYSFTSYSSYLYPGSEPADSNEGRTVRCIVDSL